MSDVPGTTHLGQGIPGGRSSLPGEITGGPGQAGLIPVSQGLPRLSSTFDAPHITPTPRTPARPTTAISAARDAQPSAKAYSISTAMALIERVHNGQMPWQDAQKVLKDLPDDQRYALQQMVMKRYSIGGQNVAGGGALPPLIQGGRVTPGPGPLDELRALSKPSPSGGGIIKNLTSDVTSLVKGFIPGTALAAKALGHDIETVFTSSPLESSGILADLTGHKVKESRFKEEVLKPVVQQEKELWGPLVQGNISEFGRRISAHPLAPLLDAFAAVSVGVGAAGRIGAAGRAVRAAEVSRTPDGIAQIGAKAGLNLKVVPLKNGLWQVRDRGRIVASRFPDENTAIAHAQSLTTGGLSGNAFKDAVRDTMRGTTEANRAKMIPMRVNMAHQDSITELWNHLENNPNFDVDHFESLLNRLGEHAHSDYNFEYKGSKQIEDPHKFLGQLGGIAEYARSIAQGPADLDRINSLIDKVYGTIATKVPLDVMKAAAGQARTLNDDILDVLERKMPEGSVQGGHPRSDPLGEVGRQDVQELLKPYEQASRSPQTARLGEAGQVRGPISMAMLGATRGGPKGNLIEAYENARGITHEDELKQIADEVLGVLENPNLRLDRRTMREVLSDVQGDIRATAARDSARVHDLASELPSFISPEGYKSLAHASVGLGVTLREASDLVRAGAIYLRPAYLPNNWAGNLFMNTVHQGLFAPINLAKSLVLDKHLGTRYTRALDQSLGANAAEVVTAAKGRGYIASITNPLAHAMGTIADQPFRRAAWLHEARRAGYETLPKVRALFDRAAGGDEVALREIASIARKASEEIVKFGHMNDIERGVLRNLVFVYSWMRGAGRYAGRFPFAHPIQTAAFNQMSYQGNDWLAANMGGVPSFLVGAIPVGRTKDGNPILINPFSLNPLGTGLQIAQAAAGTVEIGKSMADSLLHGRRPTNFDKFAQSDFVSLLNPIAQAAIEGHSGEPVDLQSSIAPLRLAKELQHPGSGSIFPTSRKEAIGHYTIGSLFPREASQAGITRSLERERANDPLALVPEQVKQFKRLTGSDVPPQFVAAYQADLVAIKQEKDFQLSYAERHGKSGFRNLPAKNRAEAAIEYLRRHRLMPQEQLDQLSDSLKTLTTDSALNDFANTLWSSTGIGSIKRAWDQMMREAKGQQLTAGRP